MIRKRDLFCKKNKFKITKPIRLIELFAGIGAQAKALENLGVSFEHYCICEWDKNSVNSYNIIHDTNFVTSDISKISADDLRIVDTDKYDYIMTYSFPCTDLSSAGKQLGMQEGSGTRSSLLWEVGRILSECKELPKVLLMENVVQVHSDSNRAEFMRWCNYLNSLGYKNYMKDLSALDYNVPQSRVRCFMISILSDDDYVFPNKIARTNTVFDYLEKSANIDYYVLSDWGKFLVKKLCGDLIFRQYLCNSASINDFKNIDIYISDCTDSFSVQQINRQIGCIKKDTRLKSCEDSSQRVLFRNNDYCGTLTTFEKDNVVIEIYKMPSGCESKTFKDFVYDFDNQKYLVLIRYLMPCECFRLMGFDKIDSDKVMSFGTSKSVMYQQTGNSIVVDVLSNIFKEMI